MRVFLERMLNGKHRCGQVVSTLHPKVFSDISKIMEYYEQVATAELADEFIN